MAVNTIKPFAGGGLGDCKIEILEFTATTGVVDFKSTPIFMCSDKGAVSYNATTKTVTVEEAGAKVLFVFKG